MKRVFLFSFALAPLGLVAPACVSDGIALDCPTGASAECETSTVPVWTGDATSTSGSGSNGTDTMNASDSGVESTSSTMATEMTSSGATETTSAQESSSGETSQDCVLFEATEVAGCSPILGTQYCAENGMHISADTPAVWTTNPPHSGMHESTWADWGVHEDFVSPRNWVHNLEHSGVVLLYSCPQGCESEIQILEEAVAQRPALRVLLTGYPELTGTRFAAVSWGWIYRTDAPDLATLLCFIDQHEGHAPENIPKRSSGPLASCGL